MENSTKTVDDAMNKSVVKQRKIPPTMAGMNTGGVLKILEKMKGSIAQALPKHITPERMLQMTSTLIVQNPKIAECSTASIVGAVMQASILGFKPVGSLGQCYFVPYNGQCQFQIGYKGYIDLSRRSGEIKMLYAEAVRKGDEFIFELGLNPKLVHKPSPDMVGEITHVYAVAHYKDGGYNFIVLTRNEVERLRMRSPMQGAAPTGAWKTDYPAMAKAKAIKQLSKYLPLSDEMAGAVQSDEAVLKPEAFKGGELKIEELEYPVMDVEAEDVTNQAVPPVKKPTPRKTKKEVPPDPEPPPEVDKNGQTTMV